MNGLQLSEAMYLVIGALLTLALQEVQYRRGRRAERDKAEADAAARELELLAELLGCASGFLWACGAKADLADQDGDPDADSSIHRAQNEYYLAEARVQLRISSAEIAQAVEDLTTLLNRIDTLAADGASDELRDKWGESIDAINRLVNRVRAQRGLGLVAWRFDGQSAAARADQ